MVDIWDNDADRPTLPSAFRLVTLRERGDAFAHACGVAADAGAGTLVVTGRFDTIEFALVLEPDDMLARARLTFFPCMDALCKALARYAPPEKPLAIRWPDTILLDGVVLGGARLAWPEATREDETPRWLVFGAEIKAEIVGALDKVPAAMSLAEAGVSHVDSIGIVFNFARHLLNALDLMTSEGMDVASREYLRRVERARAGEDLMLAENGDLLVKLHNAEEPERRPFLSAMQAQSWRTEISREQDG